MKSDPQEYSDQEIDARREAGLKKLLAMPPKPHKEEAGRKPGPKVVKSPKAQRALK